MSESFRHEDDDRLVLFGEDALRAGEGLLGDGYTLLSTERVLQAAHGRADDVLGRASSTVMVPSGGVSGVAAGLRDVVVGKRLVALGGGRVIDVAKALAAADPPRSVLAIATTLSGAEMTGMHRHADGVPVGTPHVRPSVVLNDPLLSASAPVENIAASSANAMGHALVALTSDLSTPIAEAIAREALSRIARAWGPSEPQRAELALGAMLAGWAVDHSGLGLHHVLAQTAVRTAGIGHAQANVALLGASIAAVRERRPGPLQRLDLELGEKLEDVAWMLCERADVHGLGALTEDEGLLEAAVRETAARRQELERIPPLLDEAQIRALYLAAGRR